MSLRVNTLPGLRLVSPSGDAGALATRRLPQALLVYLAVERSASRDTLLGLLWPERDEERARHSLSQALHELRANLGEDCLAGVGDVVAIGAGVETDLARFETALEGGRWAEALELYGGDFLDGAHLAPTRAFEEWVDRRRAQLARLHRRARRELVSERLAAGDLTGALAVAERWAEVAPLDDEAQQRTVELLARVGRRAEALQQYERFRELLRADDLEPMPELVLLAAEIAAGRLEPAPQPMTSPPPPQARAAPTASQATPLAPPVAAAPPEPTAAPAAEAAARAEVVPTVVTPGAVAPAVPVGPGAGPARPRLNRDLFTGALVGVLIGAPSALLAAVLLRFVAPALAPRALMPGNAVLLATGLLLVLAAIVLAWRLRPRWSHAQARPVSAARTPSRGLGAGLGFVLGFLVALSLAYTLAPPPGTPARATGPHEGKAARVAVTRFVNRAGEPALEPIGRMAEDWVARRLRSIPEALLVSTAGASPADTSARAVAELARRTGAQVVVLGSYYREGADVLLVAQLVPAPDLDVPELALQPIGPVRTPRDRPTGGAERLAALVAGALAAACRSPECAPGRAPPTYEARAAWLDALAANTQRGDVAAAREGFRLAIKLDSAFANAYTGLANSYLLSGLCPQVDSIGDILEARHSDFSLYDLLYMRAMRATCRGDLEAAYQYRAEALGIGPDNTGARWGAAEAASAAGRLAEAERLLAGMENTWYRGELYYYTLYTAVLHYEGKIAEELRLADSARARLPSTAYGFQLGVLGLAALGRTEAIEARFAEARRGQMRTVPLAELYFAAGLELEWHGHPQEARQFATRALEELERATPTGRASPAYRVKRGTLLVQLGRWREARPLLDGVAIAEVDGLRRGKVSPAMLLALRGVAAAKTGDAVAARSALAAIQRLPERAVAAPRGAPREACEAAVLAALGQKQEALRRLGDGQARGTVPRSSPGFAHADLLLRDLWHDPELDRMFAARG